MATAKKRCTLYFAYGSNMDGEQMVTRTPWARRVGWGRLKDWRLEFRGVADVREVKGAEVLGALWQITPADLSRLDRYEGYPSLYDRQVVEVETLQGRRNAIVYVMTGIGGRRATTNLSPPSRWYLDGIRQGYRQLQLPQKGLDAAVVRAGQRPMEPRHRTTVSRSYDLTTQSQTTFSYNVPRELEFKTCEWCGEKSPTVEHDDPSIPADCCEQCWIAATYMRDQ